MIGWATQGSESKVDMCTYIGAEQHVHQTKEKEQTNTKKYMYLRRPLHHRPLHRRPLPKQMQKQMQKQMKNLNVAAASKSGVLM